MNPPARPPSKPPRLSFFRQAFTVAWKDLRSELRTKEALNASFAFALVILLLFSIAFEPTEDETRQISGGLLWLVFAFAGALILNRSFARELANDCLDALIAAPMSGAALFLGKALANFAAALGGGVRLPAGLRRALQRDVGRTSSGRSPASSRSAPGD